MKQFEQRFLLGILGIIAITGLLYVLSSLLVYSIGLGIISLLGYGVYMLRPLIISQNNPEVILRINDFFRTPLAIEAESIIKKLTTNEYYKGYMDINKVFEDEKMLYTLEQYKEQLEFYARNFKKEIIQSGMTDKFNELGHKLFYVNTNTFLHITHTN